jgi:hypothetical protein
VLICTPQSTTKKLPIMILISKYLKPVINLPHVNVSTQASTPI